MKNIEEWRPVVCYEGLYEVSNQGRVRSLPRKSCKGKIIKPSIYKSGYLVVTFSKNGVHKQFLVHRLVAEAFIPNPEHKAQCNHINEDKTDNRVCNLNWMTSKENINWGTGRERMLLSRNKNNSYSSEKPVKQMTIDGKVIKIWKSTMEADRNGFNFRNISGCCLGRQKTHAGFIWQYA